MEDETGILEKTPTPETYQVKKTTSLWRWYFGWHPRLFLTVPAFLIFVIYGIWYIVAEFQDVIYFFQNKPITWGSILLVLLFGSVLLWFIIAPIYISFCSISWLYEVNIKDSTAWKKFLSSIGIILLVLFGTSIIRLFTNWILGIL
jgi:hypothetical protein